MDTATPSYGPPCPSIIQRETAALKIEPPLHGRMKVLLYDGFFSLPSCGNFCIGIIFKSIEQFFLRIKWAYTLVGIPIKDECLILLRLCVIGHKRTTDRHLKSFFPTILPSKIDLRISS